MRTRIRSLVIVGVALSTSVSAHAQAVGSTAPAVEPTTSAQRGAGLDEIVVTAQRRAQNLTDVPLSISASTGEQLVASGIQEISGLANTTPGFVASSGVGFTQLYIRGIGNAIYVGADPSVATFIDDVPRIYANLINNFINVERVEVLKGAQGGLYGRNATGGVVNIITRQPTDELGMNARFSYGERDTVDASAYVNVPFNENVAANLSVTRQVHDPYIKNLARSNPYPAGTTIAGLDANAGVKTPKLNDQDLWAVDGKLRLDATDQLQIVLAGDFARKRDSYGNAWLQRDPATAYATYVGLANLLGATAVLPPFTTPTEKFTTYGTTDNYVNIDDYGTSVRATLGLTGVDLTSITSFRWNEIHQNNEIGAGPAPITGVEVNYKRNNFYQELRAVSSGTGPLSFVTGATYLRDSSDNAVRASLLGVLPVSDTSSTIRTKAWSVYGQVGYDLTERLNLTGSLRYIHERKVVAFPDAGAPSARVTNKKLLPSATLSYDLDGGTIYARYAKGFKTGGINPVTPPALFPSPVGSFFEPEQVDTYEVGYRAQLFDRTLQFTSAIFYNDYKDLQIVGNSTDPAFPYIVLNADKARTYGAEASVTWRVAQPVTISANLGYLNAKYTDFSIPAVGIVGAQNNTGNRMSFSPRWQGSVTVDVEQPINDDMELAANAVYSYISSLYFDPTNVAAGRQDSYSLINGRVGVRLQDERVGFYVFARNLLNKQYFTYGSAPSPQGYLVAFGDPRVIGGTIELKF